MKHIRGVVFDLDGTLAATEHLAFEERVPFKLLDGHPVDRAKSRWATKGIALPGQLMAQGYRVAVVSRSPAPYAWTLAWLLHLDFEELLAGSTPFGSSPAKKLTHLAELWNLTPREVMYVGDTYDDQRAAEQIGCAFHPPWWYPTGRKRPRLDVVRTSVPLEVVVPALPPAGVGDATCAPLDDAAERIIAGAGLVDDHQLLLGRGYKAFLVEYGDTELLPPDLHAIRTTPGDPPWTDPRDPAVWQDLVKTGDANRLLDMDQAMLMFRLPDATLDAALAREAEAGGFRIIDEALRGLDPLVQRKIALPERPRSPWSRLEHELRSLSGATAAATELAATTLIHDETRCQVALRTLAHDPGSPARRGLQSIALAHLPLTAGACLIQTTRHADGALRQPGLPGWLLTRAEYDTDAELRQLLMDRMRAWFPLQLVEATGSNACVRYRDNRWGDSLWVTAKDWRGSNSGPRVHLNLVEFPSLVLAAHLASADVELVVAAPSSQFTADRPAQMSLRLAHRAADLAGLPFMPSLRKVADGQMELDNLANSLLVGRRIAVIDDQTTSGSTFNACRSALRGASPRSVDLYSWSHSYAMDVWTTIHDVHGCWLRAAGLAGTHPRLHCRSRGS